MRFFCEWIFILNTYFIQDFSQFLALFPSYGNTITTLKFIHQGQPIRCHGTSWNHNASYRTDLTRLWSSQLSLSSIHDKRRTWMYGRLNNGLFVSASKQTLSHWIYISAPCDIASRNHITCYTQTGTLETLLIYWISSIPQSSDL